MEELKTLLKDLIDVALILLVCLCFFALVLMGCKPGKDLTIPKEPTVWVVSEIYIPGDARFNGMVGYKLIPINPGSINARPTWKLDYRGKYQVGQRVDFLPIEVDR